MITKSEIGINYKTVKVTKSRIDKGLLAIPSAFIDKFPKQKQKISIYFDNEESSKMKSFTPYTSSSRECRIGGLAKWFRKNGFQDKDEVFIEFIDEVEGIYRLHKEKNFVDEIKNIEKELVESLNKKGLDKAKIEDRIVSLSRKTKQTEKEILHQQYLKIKDLEKVERQYKAVNIRKRKENVPFLMRKILDEVYEGKCQISNFTFLQKNGKPYFEIHHIDENRGNDWKNLLVVSPNIHARFTYGNYQNFFDKQGWLTRVSFDNKEHEVKQLLNKLGTEQTFIKTVY